MTHQQKLAGSALLRATRVAIPTPRSYFLPRQALATAPSTLTNDSDSPSSPHVLSPLISPISSEQPRIPIVLRPYQEECVQSCLDALQKEGVTRIGVSAPTGSGKTTMFCNLISRLPNVGDKFRALILVGNIELARQAAEQMRRHSPELSVEIEQGALNVSSGEADVTVATYQTLNQRERLEKFDPATFKVVIVDEAHHAVAPSYIRTLQYFNAEVGRKTLEDPNETTLDPGERVPIVGFSATFARHDDIMLGRVFQEIAYHRHFGEMMNESWLCDLKFTVVRTQLDLSSVEINKSSGDFATKSLAHLVNTPPMNELIVRSWLDRAAERKSTLVFCVNVQHVKDVTAVFREKGIDARYLVGSTKSTERQAVLEDFRRGVFPVLVNCAILTEGADVPNIDCVMVARPTRSRIVFSQIIGRGMRLSPNTGKEDCRIIDFVDSANRVTGMMDGPTLFGIDPDEILDEDAIPSSASSTLQSPKHHSSEQYSTAFSPDGDTSPERSTSLKPDIPYPKTVTFHEYDDPFSMFEDASYQGSSPNAWVQCGDGIWILDCFNKGFLRVEQRKENQVYQTIPPGTTFFELFFTRELKASGNEKAYARRRSVSVSDTLQTALRNGDIVAKQQLKNPTSLQSLRRDAPWRKRPASESQKRLILKMSAGRRGMDAKSLDLNEMSMGQAFAILTRIRHGSLGRFEKKRALAAKFASQQAKEKAQLQGWDIKVGPLAQ